MARQIIDISVTLQEGIKSDPDFMLPKIAYETHDKTQDQICAFFPGLKPADLPDGMGWAAENVQLSTHNGTHVDAPWHYHPTMDNGKRAATIDEVPLEWFHQPGVKLDFRRFPDGYVVMPGDIEAELKHIGHTLKPLDIVLANTAAGARYGADDFIHRGCGFGRAATLWLTERGVRVVGTDGWSWDAPFSHTRKRWDETRDPSIIWEGHKAGMVRGYCQIEKLGNLAALPATGFTVVCFPMKIKGASAGWTRAVAIVD
ncbi:MAG TPA: cyclase family protein [Alphaproteobacteria bacterium]